MLKFRQSSKPLSSTRPFWCDIRGETEWIRIQRVSVIKKSLTVESRAPEFNSWLYWLWHWASGASVSLKTVILPEIHSGTSTNQHLARWLAWCLLHYKFCCLFVCFLTVIFNLRQGSMWFRMASSCYITEGDLECLILWPAHFEVWDQSRHHHASLSVARDRM